MSAPWLAAVSYLGEESRWTRGMEASEKPHVTNLGHIDANWLIKNVISKILKGKRKWLTYNHIVVPSCPCTLIQPPEMARAPKRLKPETKNASQSPVYVPYRFFKDPNNTAAPWAKISGTY